MRFCALSSVFRLQKISLPASLDTSIAVSAFSQAYGNRYLRSRSNTLSTGVAFLKVIEVEVGVGMVVVVVVVVVVGYIDMGI